MPILTTGDTGGVHLKSWIQEDELYEEKLFEQVQDCCQMPMAFHHMALMPDAHMGYGMPIGGVVALHRAVSPAMVGYDIGCGMLAVKTNIEKDYFLSHRVVINREIKKAIPIGVGGIRRETSPYYFVDYDGEEKLVDGYIADQKLINKVEMQTGTLGAGNHFIEFGYDEDGMIWFVIHSGSRGVGHTFATHYMEIAQELNLLWYSQAPKELPFLPEGSDEYDQYFDAMNFALDWAMENRTAMMMHIIDVLEARFRNLEFSSEINVHHNFAAIENHFGKNVVVHRKGATRAREGEQLVIPGNMGQGTMIAIGLGNEDSFKSCSHGAGRRLGRMQAKRELNIEDEKAKLDSLDVVLSAGRDGALDEMPAAYKDLNEVMEAQKDLVSIESHLTPVSVVKG